MLERVIKDVRFDEKRAFEIGCGNGATAIFLSELGFDVTGVDPSVSGIEVANRSFPHLNLHEGRACDDPTFMDEMNRVVHLREGNNGPLFELDPDYFIHHSEEVAMTWNDGEPGMGPVFSKKLEELLGPARQPDPEQCRALVGLGHEVHVFHHQRGR